MHPANALRAVLVCALCCETRALLLSHPAPICFRKSHSSYHRSSFMQRHVVLIDDAGIDVTSSALDTFFQSQPYLAAFLTCGFKAGTADLLAQKKSSKVSPVPVPVTDSVPMPVNLKSYSHRSELTTASSSSASTFDLSRTLSFIFYGGLVQGMFQQFLYSVIYPIMFGSDHTIISTLQQVAFDVGVMPFVYLPLVYAIKSVFQSNSDIDNHNQSQLDDAIRNGMRKLSDDILHKGLLRKYWSIWIPAQALTFSIVPDHLRVLFVAAVSFGWVIILSSIASSDTTSTNDQGMEKKEKGCSSHSRYDTPFGSLSQLSPRISFVKSGTSY